MLGRPNEKIRNEIRNTNLLTYLMENCATIEQKTWGQLIPNGSPEALDLISKLITYDPDERLTAKEALQHPFLAEIYDPEDDSDIIEKEPVNYYDFEFE